MFRGPHETPPGGAAPWLEKLRPALPESLRPHLLEVIEKPDELVLLVDSATWAGRFRLALPELAPLAGGRRLTVRLARGTRVR